MEKAIWICLAIPCSHLAYLSVSLLLSAFLLLCIYGPENKKALLITEGGNADRVFALVLGAI